MGELKPQQLTKSQKLLAGVSAIALALTSMGISAFADGGISTQAELKVEAPADDSIKIGTLAELKAFRDGINANPASYKEKTVKLTTDIDLNNEPWTPIKASYLTFDGQSHTIKNLKVDTENKNVGFFGEASISTVKDLTIDGAYVKGINHVAAIAGDGLCGQFINCHVKNATVTTVVKDNDDGDKAGGICGYLSGEPDAKVTNCSVENAVIKGYRDCGAVVGYANSTSTVTGNTAKDVTLYCDNSVNYKNYTTAAEHDINEVIGEKVPTATASNNTATNVKVVKEAKIGDTEYFTFAEAISAATDGVTVTLLDDASGDGIVVPENSNFTIDFNGHTYTVNTDNLAGSTGTKSQCFQLLKGSTLTFKNGAIVGDNPGIKMLIQNYSKLTLDNMTLDATQGTNNVSYVVSTNNGSTLIKNTKIVAKTGKFAFDVCIFSEYESNEVAVEEISVINGDIEVSRYNGNIKPISLKIKDGKFTGSIKIADDSDPAITEENAKEIISIVGGVFSTSPSAYLADGYIVKDNDDATYPYTVAKGSNDATSDVVATIETKTEEGSTELETKKYTSVKEALVEAAPATAQEEAKTVVITKSATVANASDCIGAKVELKNNATLVTKDVVLKKVTPASETPQSAIKYEIVDETVSTSDKDTYVQFTSGETYNQLDVQKVDAVDNTKSTYLQVTASSQEKPFEKKLTDLPELNINTIFSIIINGIPKDTTVTSKIVTK